MKNDTAVTLSGILDIPQIRPWDLSKAKVSDVFTAAKAFMEHQDGNLLPKATDEAIEFYTLNHLVSVIKRHKTPNQILGEEDQLVAYRYRNVLLSQAQRVFYYLIFITSREFRHAWEHHSLPADMLKQYNEVIGPEIMALQKMVRGQNVENTLDAFGHSEMLLGNVYKGVEQVFDMAKFHGGFGGKPWAHITHCLNFAISGQYSMEMLVDTSYTLAHNNGPMHNKGMLYTDNSGNLLKILDVQRAGMLPEYLMESQDSKFSELTALVEGVKKRYPDELGDYVNWLQVKSRGAVTDLDEEIAEFKHKHPEAKVVKPLKKINGKLDTGEIYAVDNETVLPILQRVA